MRKKIYPLFLWGVIALFSSMAYAEEKILPKPIFILTKGIWTEVCRAYWQRLNTTEFLNNDPLHGRLTEPLLEGFIDLKPVEMTAEEILRVYYKTSSFSDYRDQDILEKYMEIHKNDKGINWRIKKSQYFLEKLNQYRTEEPYLRYQTLLDMDNDGIATNTVIKNRYGVYIVDSSLQRVDDASMKAIFADRELLEWPAITQFPPLAALITVFGYKGQYYFDGFLDMSFGSYGHGVDRNEPLRLGVFMHQHHQTQKICEYRLLNEPRKHQRPPAPHYVF